MGQMLEHGRTLRCAVSISLAFFGVGGTSGIAGLRVADLKADEACGVVEIKVRCQKNDQFGVGQIARVAPLPSWGGACQVRLVSEWLWSRAWLVRSRDHAGRLATSSDEIPLCVGLASARFGPGPASSGVSAS